MMFEIERAEALWIALKFKTKQESGSSKIKCPVLTETEQYYNNIINWLVVEVVACSAEASSRRVVTERDWSLVPLGCLPELP